MYTNCKIKKVSVYIIRILSLVLFITLSKLFYQIVNYNIKLSFELKKKKLQNLFLKKKSIFFNWMIADKIFWDIR